MWQCSIAAQLLVLILLFGKRNFRKLPRFTIYIALNFCQAGLLWVLYSVPGIDDGTLRTVAWETEAITLVAQALATAEVLGVILKPYPSIWGLGWRALMAVSTLVLVFVVAATRRAEPAARLFEVNRGYHLVFASAVIACLLLIRYYAVPVAAAYKLILGGFCFFSCMQILINTVIEVLFQRRFLKFGPLWDFATVSSFFAVLVVWLVALWRALPAEDTQLPSHGTSTYQQLSPLVNEELRQLNEKLAHFWKLEARPD